MSGPTTSIEPFVFDVVGSRVIFERGAAATWVQKEFATMGTQRALVIVAEPERETAERITADIQARIVGHFTGVRPHVPAAVAENAVRVARELDADLLVSIGGGSTTGTAKAIALATALPIISVPTTYAGSELTPVWGMTSSGRKETGRAPVVQPRVVIYDPELLVSLPRPLAVSSALNAMAHALEGLWVSSSSPVSDLYAYESARALMDGLRGIRDDRSLVEDQLLLGAYLAGATFAATGSGLHHKICHVLGGAFDLPHAQTHAVVLPLVLALNAPSIPRKISCLSDAFGTDDPLEELRDVYASLGVPQTLVEIGFDPKQLDLAIDLLSAKLPIENVTLVSRAELAELMALATWGRKA